MNVVLYICPLLHEHEHQWQCADRTTACQAYLKGFVHHRAAAGQGTKSENQLVSF